MTDFFPLTDSRQLLFPAQSRFFAIRGEHHDGHRFIGELYGRGVRQFVVETAALTPALRTELAGYADAHIQEVTSSLTALQTEAAERRRRFGGPVVGITGSNGKTIVKEWLAQVLEPDFWIQKSPKSYNSQLGVPLSVWPLTDRHTLGIFEAGISRPGEMAALQPVICPTLGIFTNIGSAHDEGFRSRRQKVAEKLRLFTQSDTLIYRKEYPEIDGEIQLLLTAVNPGIRLLGWSTEEGADVAVRFEPDGTGIALRLAWEGRLYRVVVPFRDEAALENATHTLLAALALGLTDEAVLNARFARLQPVSMRLELKEGVRRNLLIDDTYNNDLAGLAIALNVLAQQDATRRKVLILSDLLQTGLPPADLYAVVSRMVQEKGVDVVIGIGPELDRHRDLLPAGSQFFGSTDALMASGALHTLTDSVVLLKGARPFAFERLVSQLVQKSHQTVLEINLDALTHNLNYYRSKVGPDTKIMVMVKAFAYGSGSAEVAGLLQHHRVDYLAVAYADEGVLLRQNGIHLPIMVMNPAPSTFPQLVAHRLEPELYSFRILDEWTRFMGENAPATGPPVHLKIDTGMHRLGFLPNELPVLSHHLAQHPALKIASVFSHLVGADEAAHTPFSEVQYAQFVEAAGHLEAALGYRPLRHLLNSAGIVRFLPYKLDMVRLGIGLYGVEASNTDPGQLLAVGTLKTVVSQIKNLAAGDTVGYSRRGVLARASRIATVALGYADGYDRRLGNGVGRMWVNGTLCPTVGAVCMDMTMIDVTEASVEEGDVVVAFGPELPVTTLAHHIGTIPYELMTGISERVKRVFFNE